MVDQMFKTGSEPSLPHSTSNKTQTPTKTNHNVRKQTEILIQPLLNKKLLKVDITSQMLGEAS